MTARALSPLLNLQDRGSLSSLVFTVGNRVSQPLFGTATIIAIQGSTLSIEAHIDGCEEPEKVAHGLALLMGLQEIAIGSDRPGFICSG